MNLKIELNAGERQGEQRLQQEGSRHNRAQRQAMVAILLRGQTASHWLISEKNNTSKGPTCMDALQFGPWATQLGTPKNDKVLVEAGTGFYTGSGKDTITGGSLPIDVDGAPGGFLVTPVVMSGGAGNDTYQFKLDAYEWGFISDASGGKDRVSFKPSHPFNPGFYDPEIQIDTVLINERDVLVVSTSLIDGGRTNGVVFADPFGRLSKDNKIEKVSFGKKNYSFKKFYKSLTKAAKSKKEYGDLYSFSEASYSELGSAGILNLEGIDDIGSLDDGSYIGIASYNNALVDGQLI